jgi:hypothetical protein
MLKLKNKWSYSKIDSRNALKMGWINSKLIFVYLEEDILRIIYNNIAINFEK